MTLHRKTNRLEHQGIKIEFVGQVAFAIFILKTIKNKNRSNFFISKSNAEYNFKVTTISSQSLLLKIILQQWLAKVCYEVYSKINNILTFSKASKQGLINCFSFFCFIFPNLVNPRSCKTFKLYSLVVAITGNR